MEAYDASVAEREKKLGRTDYQGIEAGERHRKSFNASGLVVVPRGSFKTPDKPTVSGVLTPELNKEWGRDALRLQTPGTKD